MPGCASSSAWDKHHNLQTAGFSSNCAGGRERMFDVHCSCNPLTNLCRCQTHLLATWICQVNGASGSMDGSNMHNLWLDGKLHL